MVPARWSDQGWTLRARHAAPTGPATVRHRRLLRGQADEAIDQGARSTHVALLVEGQGTRRATSPTLLLKEEDRQGSEERQVLSRSTVSHSTAVFILSPIPSVMLTILNGPMRTECIEELSDRGLVFPKTADGITDIVGCFPNLPSAQMLAGALNTQQASGPGQTDLQRSNGSMPDAVGGNAPVSLFSPLQ